MSSTFDIRHSILGIQLSLNSQLPYDVIIIGGGLAGLSAAVELTARGYKILLLEQRPFLGGRTYSFVDETTGDVVDNGQHLLMGCYHETRWFLKTIGSDHLATLQPNLRIDFLHPKKGFASLSCPPLPAPLHILAGLMNLDTIPFSHRLKLLKVGKELLTTSPEKERKLESMTVDEWLTSLGQTEENKKYLWNIIAIGTLNDDPRTVSALLFYRVLRAAFLGKRENSCLLVPRAGLSKLLVDPAVRFIRARSGLIKVGCGVERILIENGKPEGVRCEDGTVLHVSVVISAVPYYALGSILKNTGHDIKESLQKFESSPIITTHLWLDRSIIEEEFVALLDSRVQWVFNRSKMLGDPPKGEAWRTSRWKGNAAQQRQYLSLVISGAAEFVEMEKEKLVTIAMEDLRRVLPEARKAKVIHSLVIKEKRATFSPKPGVEALRPSNKTLFENFFLAGDWTKTGYPATIEGAVMSGKAAAKQVSISLKHKHLA